ncbi:tetratricopeptide repeat protein [Tenacibaculum jejuense]|uniref:HTH luxR-type domain-containing protein n=1 Tax=Tenacibaculum jejuense TaxID=584609 RepID=A0A238UCA7_9FLAO|nr:hypothetical protein [Tenacibaculum jejuense]SNR16626.1 Probable transmembrane protein of unknown function containing tetratricopeptide repeats [Tenacibaculum jejuense]
MHKSLSLLLFFIIFLFSMNQVLGQDNDPDKVYEKAIKIRLEHPDSAIYLFSKSYNKYIQQKDTIKAIYSILNESEVYENNAKYAKSYEILWKAVIMLDESKNESLKSVLYHRLGRIFSYHKREKESIEYLKKALNIQKAITKKNNFSKVNLVPYYYSLVATYRELNNDALTKAYLDSCYMYYKKKESLVAKAFIDFEKACQFIKSDSKKAIELLDELYPWFKKNSPTYLVLFNKYKGDAYFEISKFEESEKCYLDALETSKKYNSHVDFTALIYGQLAKLYAEKGNYKSAFVNLKKEKELDQEVFDIRSERNQNHIEIKNEYLIEKEKQNQLLQEQYLKQLEQEDKIKNLQRIVLLISIIFILAIGFSYVKRLRYKHFSERKMLEMSKELEIKKKNEMLDLKNKELATSALQIIEKDELLKMLKNKIETAKTDKSKVSEINNVLRTISVSNNKNWEEFKLRFVDVNKEFYDKVFERFPNLSQGDQKICALIKLNFSSKDMAKLLGISVESVHTSRHRIRKKMNLDRSINLEDFINSI